MTLNQHDVFDSLAHNAFDFLEREIGEFDQAPMYSVIHSCAAVAMRVKVRLMREHWSLIVSKPDQANLTKFMAGDFASVTMDEAKTCIRDTADEDIADDAFNCFRALANHHNKMIHFFHAGMDGDGQTEAQSTVEHRRSWFRLHHLLNRWDVYFRDFLAAIARADRSMKAHKNYLSAKFRAPRPELDARRTAEHSYLTGCNHCDGKAGWEKDD